MCVNMWEAVIKRVCLDFLTVLKMNRKTKSLLKIYEKLIIKNHLTD